MKAEQVQAPSEYNDRQSRAYMYLYTYINTMVRTFFTTTLKKGAPLKYLKTNNSNTT